jgi:TolA-binding protein
MKFLSFCLLLALSVSCIKTADQVNREKRMDSMNAQLADSQGLVADMVGQMKDMQSQLDKLNGKIEEMEHKNKGVNEESFAKVNESMALMKAQQDTQGTQLQGIQTELKDQKAFLEKLMSSLSAAQANNTPKSQKKSAKSDLAEALSLIKSNDYSEAREILEGLIDNNDLSPGDHNKVLHGLGKVEYYTKNYEKGLVYFSKIYSKYPKASLAPSSLLFIGRSLDKMDKKPEAKEAFAKVIEDYAGTSEAKEAKKEL